MSDDTNMGDNENDTDKLFDEIETLEAEQAEENDPSDHAIMTEENAQLRDKLLRMTAEMENLRKRTERDVADTRAYAIAGFARDMLSATDNLSRALMVLPQQAREAADVPLKSLIEGIEMTEREMQRLLQKNGVKPIEAEGQKFDPHRHQAMFEVPNTEVPEGTVVQVVQTGFAIGERVLRPAMVGVAKGGPKGGAPKSEAKTGDEKPASPKEAGVDKRA